MNFDWDNKHNIIGHWPHNSAGEFIVRCLGFSSNRIFPYNSENPPLTYDDKWLELENTHPILDDWHSKFRGSNDWMKFAPYIPVHVPEDIWVNSELASRQFFDRLFDPTRIPRDFGITFKCHTVSQFNGLRHLMPNAKAFTVVNHSRWDEIRNFIVHKTVSLVPEHERKVPAYYEMFRFDIEKLLFSTQNSYLDHIREAYHYFDLKDFNQAMPYLIQWRRLYFRWNINLKSKNQLRKPS